MGQVKYSLDEESLKKIGKGFLIAVGGLGATYLQDLIPNIDWGQYAPIAVAVNSVVINIIREWLKGV